MHYRKPIVTANSGAAPEVVLNGVTGLLVNYGDSDEIAHAITSLCLNSELRRRLGAAGYERLQENFTFDQFKTKLREILLRETVVNSSIAEPANANADIAA